MANLPTLQLTPQITEAFQPQVLEVIRTSIAPSANDQEFLLFAHKAASYGLDPFKNEIFFIKYGNTARIQFAAEAYLAKAREKEGFQPPNTQMVHEKDVFTVAMNQETKELEVIEHTISFPRGKIIGAYSVAYRDGFRPVTVIMDIDEVSHMFTGQNKDNWTKWTSDMFGKHVQIRALKKQYGLEFEDETISQEQSAVPAYQPQQRKDIIPQQEAITPPKQEIVSTEEDEITALRKQLTKLLKEIGVTGKAAINDYIKANAPQVIEKPTVDNIEQLIAIVQMQIDMNLSDELE